MVSAQMFPSNAAGPPSGGPAFAFLGARRCEDNDPCRLPPFLPSRRPKQPRTADATYTLDVTVQPRSHREDIVPPSRRRFRNDPLDPSRDGCRGFAAAGRRRRSCLDILFVALRRPDHVWQSHVRFRSVRALCAAVLRAAHLLPARRLCPRDRFFRGQPPCGRPREELGCNTRRLCGCGEPAESMWPERLCAARRSVGRVRSPNVPPGDLRPRLRTIGLPAAGSAKNGVALRGRFCYDDRPIRAVAADCREFTLPPGSAPAP